MPWCNARNSPRGKRRGIWPPSTAERSTAK
ncbi:hypothetical protein ACFQE3_13210 [Deinococcus aquaticus]